MSPVEGQADSTPNKNRTSTRSQAGNQQYLRDEVKDDLELDLENATKCDVDSVLKYFLYLILDENSDERKELDKIQDRIEDLQRERYYRTENDDTNQSGLDMTEGAAMGTYEQARREVPNDDTTDSDEENQLVQRRETVLDEILEKVVQNILPLANDIKTRKLLKKFGDEFTQQEKSRYAPYVLLCNYLLDALKKVAPEVQVRSADPIDIRFHRNDPRIIFSTLFGKTDELKRVPDVVITSLFAARRTGNRGAGVFVNPPTRKGSFEWQAILLNNEFKVRKNTIPDSAKHINKEDFNYGMAPGPKIEHRELVVQDPDVVETDGPSVAKDSITAKRSRDDDDDEEEDNEPDSLHVPKKRRGSNSVSPIPSGSKGNSAAISTSGTQSRVGLETELQKKQMMEPQTKQAISGRVQCASYGMEVLSYSTGVHHAINLLFTDDYLWIWYYDRQGIIQSNGMSIFSDFPRFLVLLFALQRFNLEDWGIIASLNPKALLAHGLAKEKPKEKPTGSSSSLQQGSGKPAAKGKAKAKVGSSLPVVSSSPVVFTVAGNLEHSWLDKNRPVVQVQLDMDAFLSNKPHCLAGRATAVVSTTGLTEASVKIPMVCKIYHPEVQRRHEGLTLQVIHDIAREHEPEMLRHLPTMYFHGDVPNTTTQRIRSMVRRSWKGHRVLRILGLKKLDKITTVDGARFVKAWLEVVICHSFLWKNYVEHGDPSVNNMMYDPEKECGVLTDFDLSLLQWEPRVFGTDRTGTVPFMAIELLTKAYWDGKIKRFHFHELESFIWILPYVFLLYEAGTRRSNPLVDVWRTSDYITCSKEKLLFLNFATLKDAGGTVQPNFEMFWQLARLLCRALGAFRFSQEGRMFDFSPESPPPSLGSNDLWDKFVTTLKSQYPEGHDLHNLVLGLEAQKPSFDEPNATLRGQLRKKFKPILQPQLDTEAND